VGVHTSLFVDSSGKVHISYYDITNVDLKYATCSSACTIEGSWLKLAADTVGDVAQYTSLFVDASGKVHISYWDITNGDLKYIALPSTYPIEAAESSIKSSYAVPLSITGAP